jgi:ketosteroid isomerase-like protein
MVADQAPPPYMASPVASYQLYRELTPRRSDRIVTHGGEPTMVTSEDLDACFGNGWNRHDVDYLMTFMADDCVFEGASGSEVCGTRYAGRERVREAFTRVFATFPDAAFREARHVVTGDRGLSEWVFTGTTTDGRTVEVNGCDLFTFRAGKIAVKSSFFKNRTA